MNLFYSVIYYLSLSPVLRCDISDVGYLGRMRTQLPHPIGIVIGRKVKLGNRCTIYQNVTIGSKDIEHWENDDNYPVLGNNVKIYANALIIGRIHIGDNAVIGAGAVVLSDVPANSIVVGNPARIIHKENTTKSK